MRITSPAFGHNQFIPARYTCDGEDVSPALGFSGIPPETESLVLIMEDPDVPKDIRPDGMWDHWVVFNIPPDILKVLEGQAPEGEPGAGTNGQLGYHGPCPPDGEHRYLFKLFALDSTLSLPPGSTKAEVKTAMSGHILAQAELLGRYRRQ